MAQLKNYIAEYTAKTHCAPSSQIIEAENLIEAKQKAQIFKKYNVTSRDGSRIKTKVYLRRPSSIVTIYHGSAEQD